jgi:dihydroxy-acid dehydratase
MREMAFLRLMVKLFGMGETNYIVTDGRFSGYSDGPCVGYLCPEAADGGAIALVQDGDRIEIDIEKRTINLMVPDDELERRRMDLVHPRKEYPGGYLGVYARSVSPADKGAVIKA